MRQVFEYVSQRKLGVAFAIAANTGIGLLIWQTLDSPAFDQTLQRPSFKNVAFMPQESQDESFPKDKIQNSFKDMVLAPIHPATVTLNNGYGLYFEDRNDLFGMQDKIINRSYYDAEYDRYHKKPPELHAAFLALEQLTPLSYQAYESAAWKETRL